MSEKGCHEIPDYKVIKCKHCYKRFRYGVLKAFFMTKMKYNPDYKPECMRCQQEWDNTFMYDNFERDFCKNILKLFDPYACIYCQERKTFIHCKVCEDCLKQHFQENGNTSFDCKKCHTVFTPEFMFDNFEDVYCHNVLKLIDPKGCYPCNDRHHRTYTCKYCNENMCHKYMMKYLKEKYEKKEEFDCVNCHHKYSDEDLDEIFGKETCKKELHIKYPEDCIICNSEKKYIVDDDNEKITCPFCNKNICIHCITECLEDESFENYNVHDNDPNIRYVLDPASHYRNKYFIDDTLHCPHCKHIWSNQYIYDIYKKYVNGYMIECQELYIAVPSMLCYKCGKMSQSGLRCKCCDKILCKSCYEKIIDEEYGLIDTSTRYYNLAKKYNYSHIRYYNLAKKYNYSYRYMLKTQLRCKECSGVLCKIKLVYSPLCHGNNQYDEYKFEFKDYKISETYSDYREWPII